MGHLPSGMGVSRRKKVEPKIDEKGGGVVIITCLVSARRRPEWSSLTSKFDTARELGTTETPCTN